MSIQKPSSTTVPVRFNSSFNCPRVNGLTLETLRNTSVVTQPGTINPFACSIVILSMIYMYIHTRLQTWTMLDSLLRGGDGCLAVRTGSSMVILTPDFCWLMERRISVSLGVTLGRKQSKKAVREITLTSMSDFLFKT